MLQIALGRVNLAATTSASLTSPRSGGPGPSRDNVNGTRKYRGSSRQSAHRGSRRHHKLNELGTYGNHLESAGSLQSTHRTTSQSPTASDIRVLPQIGASAGSQNNLGKRYQLQHSTLAPSPVTLKEANNLSTGNNSYEEHSFSACTSIKGLKPGNPNWTNQDNFFISENFDGKDYRIYCVLDGHGENGHHASRRCREYFPQFIRAANMDFPQAFNMMQNDLNASDIDVKCSGATCVLACFSPTGKISVYNCGDSRCVLGRRNPNGSIVAHPLSNDHKPDRPEERKRILACGGHLGCRQVLVNQGGRGPVSMPVGPCRVWYQHRGETLGLAMSRSLGDTVVHKSGVSADPEVIEHMVDENDEFCILATDGVWDVVDNNHAVQMVHNFAVRSVNWSPLEASNCITKFARSRWEKLSPMVDDITCIVVKIYR